MSVSRRETASQRKAKRRLEVAAAQEAKAEALAPYVTRVAIVDSGMTLRGPRLTVSSTGRAEQASVVRNLFARQSKRETPSITERHVEVAERFLGAWREVAGGVGFGSSLAGLDSPRTGSPGSGVSNAKQEAILWQVRQRQELITGLDRLGSLGVVVIRVVVEGVDLTTWAADADMNRATALGFLVAALDVLRDHYDRVDGGERRHA